MRGRFAPSPTGPLHFGSLVTAVGSYADARVQGGEWILRMEDVDRPREVPGAADGILATLERYGFEWDGLVLFQSSRTEAYQAALDSLLHRGLAFPCVCSRREAGEIYSGACRDGTPSGRSTMAWRARIEPQTISFVDRWQGSFTQELASSVGDFVLKRSDGLFAYQLAVVADDGAQGITDVVRGADLLDSTPRQIWLQRALGLPTPRYLHLPLAVDCSGQKLSKQTRAPAVDRLPEAPTLWSVLAFLGLRPPSELRAAGLSELWSWAFANWSVQSTNPKR